jgi:hypothetical protein
MIFTLIFSIPFDSVKLYIMDAVINSLALFKYRLLIDFKGFWKLEESNFFWNAKSVSEDHDLEKIIENGAWFDFE